MRLRASARHEVINCMEWILMDKSWTSHGQLKFSTVSYIYPDWPSRFDLMYKIAPSGGA